MPKSKAPRIAPATSTTTNILHGLRSPSQTHSFVAYLKPSDYAREGLKPVCRRISNADPSPSVLEDAIDHRTAGTSLAFRHILPPALSSLPHSTQSFRPLPCRACALITLCCEHIGTRRNRRRSPSHYDHHQQLQPLHPPRPPLHPNLPAQRRLTRRARRVVAGVAAQVD